VGRRADKGVALSIDGKIYDPTDPMGKMFIGVLGLMAEFESDPIQSRTRDAAAAAAGKMKGRQHKLTPEERAYLLQTYATGQFNRNTLQKRGLSNSIVVFAFWHEMRSTECAVQVRCDEVLDAGSDVDVQCSGAVSGSDGARHRVQASRRTVGVSLNSAEVMAFSVMPMMAGFCALSASAYPVLGVTHAASSVPISKSSSTASV